MVIFRWQAGKLLKLAFAEEEKLERAWTPKTKMTAEGALNPDSAAGERLRKRGRNPIEFLYDQKYKTAS